MKRKQLPCESVDQYVQEFESLFDCSYGRQSGMDQESKDLQKCDLFVLGLKMKLQEKALLSAQTLADSLHQARMVSQMVVISVGSPSACGWCMLLYKENGKSSTSDQYK